MDQKDADAVSNLIKRARIEATQAAAAMVEEHADKLRQLRHPRQPLKADLRLISALEVIAGEIRRRAKL